VPNLVVTILDLIDEDTTSSALEWVFNTLFPNYNLGKAMVNLFSNYDYRNICLNKIPAAYGNVSLDTICERVEQYNLTLACCKGKPTV